MGTTVADDQLVLGQVPVSETFRRARQDAGLSVSALARAAATSRAAVHAYETGAREPTMGTALRLLSCCGLTLMLVPLGPPST